MIFCDDDNFLVFVANDCKVEIVHNTLDHKTWKGEKIFVKWIQNSLEYTITWKYFVKSMICPWHSVEKYSKRRSRFLEKKLQFFRQIKANLPISSIYYIKPPWQNANIKFSRKFAPEVSTAFNRGGFNLNHSFEKSADTWRYQKLFQCKVGLFLARHTPLIIGVSEKFFCVISLLKPTLQNLFSPLNPKIPPKYRNSSICKIGIGKILPCILTENFSAW